MKSDKELGWFSVASSCRRKELLWWVMECFKIGMHRLQEGMTIAKAITCLILAKISLLDSQVLWPPPPPVVAGKSVHQTLTEIRAILELHLLKHESTVNEYAKQFEAILPYAPISKSTAINVFILGLQPAIRKVVQDFNPSSLDSAIYFAYLQEKYGKKVNQESKNAKVDVLKGDQVASCPNDSSQNDNAAVGDNAQDNELVAEARGTLKDYDKGEDEGMTDLEVHETDSQEDGIQTEEYGRLGQTASKISGNADLEQIEGEYEAISNLTVDVAKETDESNARKVDVRASQLASSSAVLRSNELHSVGQPPPPAVISLKSCPATVHTVVPEAVKSALSSLLKIDICGPSIPKMLGLEGQEIQRNRGWSLVYVESNLGFMSIGFMLTHPDEAVIRRGPRKCGLIKQFLHRERFSQMLTPKVRAAMEYLSLFGAITLFCILVVMQANYVQQPGCSSELTGVVTSEAQLIQIKITSVSLWSLNKSDPTRTDSLDTTTVADEIEVSDADGDGLAFLAARFWLNWVGFGPWRGKSVFKFWKSDAEFTDHQAEMSISSLNSKTVDGDAVVKVDKEESRNSFSLSAKETWEAAIMHFGEKWYKRISFVWRFLTKIFGSFQKLGYIAGIDLDLDIPKWMVVLHLDKLSSSAVQWLEKGSKAFEPTFLFNAEEGGSIADGHGRPNNKSGWGNSVFWSDAESKKFLEFDSRGSNQKFTVLGLPLVAVMTHYWHGNWIWIPHSHMGSKDFGLMCGILLLKFK